MNITKAQYTTAKKEMIKATIDNIECFVPTDPANRHYAEILKQVKERRLIIKEAE